MTSTNSASAGSRKSIFMYQDLPRRRTIVFHALVRNSSTLQQLWK